MSHLTIGQLAKAAGVNVETIRYYERRGLIPAPPRRDSGYRQYSPEYTKRVQFIKRAQTLGFSLKEIGDLLDLRVEPNAACEDVRQQAEKKIVDIEQKIETLTRMKAVLSELVNACNHRELTDNCPILAILEIDDDLQ